MARPLPKTNAPALVKKSRISHRTLLCAVAAAAARTGSARIPGATPKTGKRERNHCGGAFTGAGAGLATSAGVGAVVMAAGVPAAPQVKGAGATADVTEEAGALNQNRRTTR